MDSVRVVAGHPNLDDVEVALASLMEIRRDDRRGWIYMRSCPFCTGVDESRSTDGAIAFSLSGNDYFSCKKCGEKCKWRKLFRKLGLAFDDSHPETPDEETDGAPVEELNPIAKIAQKIRSVAMSAKGSDSHARDHGDHGLDYGLALEQHAMRLMAPSSQVRAYLERRGFSFPADYAEYLGNVWVGECCGGWATFVYRERDGKIRGFKCFDISTGSMGTSGETKKNFYAPGNVQSRPYGIERIEAEHRIVTITEGEIDCETLSRIYGEKNVISLPNGASTWNPKWIEFFEHAETLYIATDRDAAGEEAAKNIFGSCAGTRAIRRLLFVDKNGKPVKDVNDAWKGGATHDAITKAYVEAPSPLHSNVESIILPHTRTFFRTGWESVDQILGGGLLSGEVSHWFGPPKSGKTEIALDIHRRMAMRGASSAFVPLDMDAPSIAARLGMALLGESDARLYAEPDLAVRETLSAQARDAMIRSYRGRMLIAHGDRIENFTQVLQVIGQMASEGAKVITVEDYSMLIDLREGEFPGKSPMFLGSRTIKDLGKVAKRFDCHVIVINHEKVTEKGMSFGANQISGRSQANIKIAARRNPSGSIVETILQFQASRYTSIADVEVSLTKAVSDGSLMAGPIRRSGKKKAKDSMDF